MRLYIQGQHPCVSYASLPGQRWLAPNVGFKLINELTLFDDHLTDNITNGNHADEMALVKHGQMSDTVIGHQLHTVVKRFMGLDRNEIAHHHIANECRLTRTTR